MINDARCPAPCEFFSMDGFQTRMIQTALFFGASVQETGGLPKPAPGETMKKHVAEHFFGLLSISIIDKELFPGNSRRVISWKRFQLGERPEKNGLMNLIGYKYVRALSFVFILDVGHIHSSSCS